MTIPIGEPGVKNWRKTTGVPKKTKSIIEIYQSIPTIPESSGIEEIEIYLKAVEELRTTTSIQSETKNLPFVGSKFHLNATKNMLGVLPILTEKALMNADHELSMKRIFGIVQQYFNIGDPFHLLPILISLINQISRPLGLEELKYDIMQKQIAPNSQRIFEISQNKNIKFIDGIRLQYLLKLYNLVWRVQTLFFGANRYAASGYAIGEEIYGEIISKRPNIVNIDENGAIIRKIIMAQSRVSSLTAQHEFLVASKILDITYDLLSQQNLRSSDLYQLAFEQHWSNKMNLKIDEYTGGSFFGYDLKSTQKQQLETIIVGVEDLLTQIQKNNFSNTIIEEISFQLLRAYLCVYGKNIDQGKFAACIASLKTSSAPSFRVISLVPQIELAYLCDNRHTEQSLLTDLEQSISDLSDGSLPTSFVNRVMQYFVRAKQRYGYKKSDAALAILLQKDEKTFLHSKRIVQMFPVVIPHMLSFLYRIDFLACLIPDFDKYVEVEERNFIAKNRCVQDARTRGWTEFLKIINNASKNLDDILREVAHIHDVGKTSILSALIKSEYSFGSGGFDQAMRESIADHTDTGVDIIRDFDEVMEDINIFVTENHHKEFDTLKDMYGFLIPEERWTGIKYSYILQILDLFKVCDLLEPVTSGIRNYNMRQKNDMPQRFNNFFRNEFSYGMDLALNPDINTRNRHRVEKQVPVMSPIGLVYLCSLYDWFHNESEDVFVGSKFEAAREEMYLVFEQLVQYDRWANIISHAIRLSDEFYPSYTPQLQWLQKRIESNKDARFQQRVRIEESIAQ